LTPTFSRLIEALEGVDETQPALPKNASDKYDAFLRVLKVRPGWYLFEQKSDSPLQKLSISKVPLPASYVDLMKKAGRIHRPFQAQAFAFVMLCRFLADQFAVIGDSAITADNIGSLEE
jgi:hypothetical protein